MWRSGHRVCTSQLEEPFTLPRDDSSHKVDFHTKTTSAATAQLSPGIRNVYVHSVSGYLRVWYIRLYMSSAAFTDGVIRQSCQSFCARKALRVTVALPKYFPSIQWNTNFADCLLFAPHIRVSLQREGQTDDLIHSRQIKQTPVCSSPSLTNTTPRGVMERIILQHSLNTTHWWTMKLWFVRATPAGD